MENELTNTEILDRDLEEFTAEQEDSLIIDFDQAVASQRAKAITVNFDGDTFKLPSEAPAWLPLFINRNTKNGEVPDEKNLEMIERLLGKEFASKIVDGDYNHVSFKLVNDTILSPVMEHWGMSMTDTTKKK